MKRLFLALLFIGFAHLLFAQQDSTGERGGFRKENLFVGGSVSLGAGDGYFQAGANPMFGYSLNRWVDAGIVVNYIHTSYRNYDPYIDKLRQNLYGGGPFLRVFPLRFLFAHAQFEHNFMAQKATPYNGGAPEKTHAGANSFLVGPGFATGRQPGADRMYGYFSIMWDLKNDVYSPYVDNKGYKQPVMRAGFILYLFGSNNNRY